MDMLAMLDLLVALEGPLRPRLASGPKYISFGKKRRVHIGHGGILKVTHAHALFKTPARV
jgi:hypothetical protein